MGVSTLGLSEAFRPMIGGGNRDLMDNIGTMGMAGVPGLLYSESQKQPPQQPIQQYQPQQMTMQPSQTPAVPSDLGMALYPPQPQSPRQAAPAGYDSPETKYRTVR